MQSEDDDPSGYYLPSTPHIYQEIYEHHQGGWSRALDLSPGSKKVVRELSKKFKSVVTLDPIRLDIWSQEQQDIFVEKLKDIPDESHDLVTIGEAAHWFEQEVFDHIGRILKPNGTLAMWIYAKPYVPGSDVATETINQIFFKYNQLLPYSEKMDKVIQNMNSGLDKIKIPKDYFKIGVNRVRVNYSNENFINVAGAYPTHLQLDLTISDVDRITHIYRNDFLSIKKPLDWFAGFMNSLFPSQQINFGQQFKREYQILEQEFGTKTNIPFSWSMNMVLATKSC